MEAETLTSKRVRPITCCHNLSELSTNNLMIKIVHNFCLYGAKAKRGHSEAEEEKVTDELLHKTENQSQHFDDF